MAPLLDEINTSKHTQRRIQHMVIGAGQQIDGLKAEIHLQDGQKNIRLGLEVKLGSGAYPSDDCCRRVYLYNTGALQRSLFPQQGQVPSQHHP